MNEKKIIELRDIAVSFDGEPVLKNLNLSISDGEFVTLLGPSGCGKTTTLRIIAGFITPDSGDVFFDGKRVNDLPAYKRTVNTIFQRYALFPHLNVYENVAFAQRVVMTPVREMKRRVPEVLGLVGLSAKYRAYPKQLSGGEQQRVAIARALVNRPEIILADEPTGNMDPENAQHIMDLLERINEMGPTVVVVTHSHEIVERMQKRVITMNRGVIVGDEKRGEADED